MRYQLLKSEKLLGDLFNKFYEKLYEMLKKGRRQIFLRAIGN